MEHAHVQRPILLEEACVVSAGQATGVPTYVIGLRAPQANSNKRAATRMSD